MELNAGYGISRTPGENERARDVLERALAFVRARELSLYVEYLLATRALIDLAVGDWDAPGQRRRGW